MSIADEARKLANKVIADRAAAENEARMREARRVQNLRDAAPETAKRMLKACEKAIRAAASDGYRETTVRFRDDDASYATEELSKLLLAEGILNKISTEQGTFRGSDDSPEETYYFVQVRCAWGN